MHTVFAHHANTLGPAFYYAEKIADQGMIGFLCCNSPAAMPAMNGREVMLGTNPFAFACPSGSHGHLVIDMATSIVAKSRFGTALENGEQLQPGWALDAEGRPTTDPAEAIKGFVLPMAGFKGYGIAMIIDLLSGLLSGAAYLNKVGKFYSADGACMNVGHMITAIDPETVFDGDFGSAMDAYIEAVRASAAVDGSGVILPGDDRKKKREESLEKGIPLSSETAAKLEALFGETIPEMVP